MDLAGFRHKTTVGLSYKMLEKIRPSPKLTVTLCLYYISWSCLTTLGKLSTPMCLCHQAI